MFEEMSSSFRILLRHNSAFAHFSARRMISEHADLHIIKIATAGLISLSLTEKRAKAEICHDHILKLEDIYSNICEN